MNLQDITTEELENQFTQVTDDDTIVALVAEMDRRERAAAAKAARADRDRARYEAIRTEWAEMAYADYLNAEQATKGNLLNRAGEATGIDPYSLWAGKDSDIRKYGSEELHNWFLDHPRTTIREYLRLAKAGKRAAREEAEMQNVNDTSTDQPEEVAEAEPAARSAATRTDRHCNVRSTDRAGHRDGRHAGHVRPTRRGGMTDDCTPHRMGRVLVRDHRTRPLLHIPRDRHPARLLLVDRCRTRDRH